MQAVSAVIGAENAPCAVSLDGRVAGAAPATLLLPENGTCHIGAHPLTPGFYGLTRAFSFADGRLLACPPDTDVYAWPDGALEIVFHCPCVPEKSEPRFPTTFARIAYSAAQAVLYEDAGVWLAFEQNGRVVAGCRVCQRADEGSLILMGRALLAAATGPEGAACVALDERFTVTARYYGEQLEREGDALALLAGAGGPAGYRVRTVLRERDGGVFAESEPAGIAAGAPDCPLPLRYLEAVRLGLWAEANALTDAPLQMPQERLEAFFGPFIISRAHPALQNVFGAGQADETGVVRMRAFTFETEQGRIVNILAES